MGSETKWTPEKFYARVDRSGDCWLWQGSIDQDGYGRVNWPTISKWAAAHRVAYLLRHGGLPSGLVIDHACRNRRCVNPDHLRPATNAENVLGGIGPTATNARKSTCMRGHALVTRGDGRRQCVECHREAKKMYMRRVRSGRPK